MIMLATIYVVGTLGGAQGGKGGYQGVEECLKYSIGICIRLGFLEIIQVLDSISWVRCASGNVVII